MYFEPISAWLVALIADGIILIDEKSRGPTVTEYNQKHVKQSNEILNNNIRRVRKDYGLGLPEMAFEKIKLHIQTTQKDFSFRYAHGQILIDLDNQDYIIELLEACEKRFSQHSIVEEYRKKAEWYKSAANEAKRRKEEYIKKCEEERILNEKTQEKEKTMTIVYTVIGFLIIAVFIAFMAS